MCYWRMPRGGTPQNPDSMVGIDNKYSDTAGSSVYGSHRWHTALNQTCCDNDRLMTRHTTSIFDQGILIKPHKDRVVQSI